MQLLLLREVASNSWVGLKKASENCRVGKVKEPKVESESISPAAARRAGTAFSQQELKKEDSSGEKVAKVNSPLLTGKDRAPNRVGHWRRKGGV